MNLQELTDRELVELCLQGNEDAWKELLRRYHSLIAGVSGRIIRRSALNRSMIPLSSLIEEAVQDTWTKICKNGGEPLRKLEWRHEKALLGLLKITASNTTKDILRKYLGGKMDAKKEVPMDDPSLVVPVINPPVDPASMNILRDELVRCLDKLLHGEPDATRDVAMFLLFFSFKITALDLARLYKLDLRKAENILARLVRLVRTKCLKSKEMRSS